MSYMDQTAFAPASGIQELAFDDIDMVAGAVDWDGVVEGLGTAAGGVVLTAGGVAVAGGSGGTAAVVGGVIASFGVVAVVAGVGQVIESAMAD